MKNSYEVYMKNKYLKFEMLSIKYKMSMNGIDLFIEKGNRTTS